MLSTPPLVSPLIWTTIATGRQVEDHGVLDFMVDLTTGAQEEIGGAARRVPAFWDLLSAAGRTVDVVGWWATWPAESIRGTFEIAFWFINTASSNLRNRIITLIPSRRGCRRKPAKQLNHPDQHPIIPATQ